MKDDKEKRVLRLQITAVIEHAVLLRMAVDDHSFKSIHEHCASAKDSSLDVAWFRHGTMDL